MISLVASPMNLKVGTVAFILIFFSALTDLAYGDLDGEECFDCHGSKEILSWTVEEVSDNTLPPVSPRTTHFVKVQDLSAYVDYERYASSVHGDLTCLDCHVDTESAPHERYLDPVSCGECHEEVAEDMGRSIHGQGSPEKGNIVYVPSCSDCHGAHYIPEIAASESPVSYNRLARTCGKCHGDKNFTKIAGITLSEAFSLYDKSIHGRAIKEKGLIRSANCVDCHGAHAILGAGVDDSPIFKKNIPETCGKCHYGIFVAYKDSVHGFAAYKGVPDAPVCTDCHGEHEIEPASEESSYVSPMAITTTTCPGCHDAMRVVRKFGISPGKTRSYRGSYHGLAIRLGNYEVANCASCHGSHGIYPSSDERSTVFKGNLKITCGKCHPGATDRFAMGSIHGEGKGTGVIVRMVVRYFYIYLIVLTIGFMLVHNAFDYVRKLLVLKRERSYAEQFERMNKIERMEHFLMIISFFGLVITGFALRFSWSIPLIAVGVNEFLRGFLHRFFALVMVGVCLHHLGYIIFTGEGRSLFMDMLPTVKDLKDVIHAVRFYMGVEGERPRFGRFSYIEKLEYMALVWGSVIMIVTGFLLWFEEEAMTLLPLWGIEVATDIHFYEAILATLAIIFWHLYFVMINPDVAPMSFTWIDGKISRHHMEVEHPLELEEIEDRG